MYVSLWKRAALCLACFGMIIPQGALVAAETPQQQAAVRMLDVKLTDGGTITGRVVDAQGKDLKRGKVAVRFQNRVVAEATTNDSGRFAVTGLMGGVHQLETVNGRVTARLWAGETAPPSAKPMALIVSDKNVIRAQCGESGCGIGGGGVIGGGSGILGHGGGNGGWVSGNSYGNGAYDGGFYDGGYGGGYGAECYDYGYAQSGGGGGIFGGGALLTGLVIAGVVTAIAVAANDDDDPASP